MATGRDAARNKTGYQDPSAAADFDRVLRTETPRLGLWLDNSDLTVAETVDRLLAYLNDESGLAFDDDSDGLATTSPG